MASNALQNWNQPEYAREYRDESDYYIPHRATLMHLVGSYASAFLGTLPRPKLMDLGCGDGAVSLALHRALPAAEILAADGSADMIGAARKRLAGMPVEFRTISFEEIAAGGLSGLRFDGIFSCLAIHHLPFEGKAALFRALRPLLGPGGHFLNVDAAMSEAPEYSDWYFTLWREWIEENQRTQHLEQSYGHIPDRARAKEENHYDALGAQLLALREAGFNNVECHYRFGIFAAYGGRNPGGARQT
jgi:ubiquinone/menaquinone biosynthesis C-methylase UbiE